MNYLTTLEHLDIAFEERNKDMRWAICNVPFELLREGFTTKILNKINWDYFFCGG